MKQVTMICTLVYEVQNDTDVEQTKGKVVDFINRSLYNEQLTCQPQIDPSASMVVTSIIPLETGSLLTPVLDEDQPKMNIDPEWAKRLTDKLNKSMYSLPVWKEIKDDFEDDGIIHVDGWETEDPDENGRVIAKINVETFDVEYIDKRAITDNMAQVIIQERVKKLKLG